MDASMQIAEALLAPIPGGNPGGEDIAYSTEIDAIREARRSDDARLAQGEWQTEIKAAQWPRMRELCESILVGRSKDMQVAAWYSEALTRLEGFIGLARGLAVWNGLLTDFWEFCYPVLDADDLEERVSKIEWLNRELALAVRMIPLTSSATGYSWLKWEESRAVDNLGLKDPAAKEAAIAEGKLSGETFDLAVTNSGLGFYERLYQDLSHAQYVLGEVMRHVDARFGQQAPSLSELRDAIAVCGEWVERQLKRLGGAAAPAVTTSVPAAAPVQPIGAHPMPPAFSGDIASRDEAIRRLREVGRYFRECEPHSPVGLLAERAAVWAEMSLDQWLGTVVKDDSTLGQLRELLGLPRSA
jgi:type VI secretion system protein ImpA